MSTPNTPSTAPTTPAEWCARADALQDSLEASFGAGWPQHLHNAVPLREGDDEVFNYWWLAHVVDVRLDAWERSGRERYLEQAVETYRNVLERNGSLYNDYFDDMLWLALAALRLADATGEQRYADDARRLWAHVVEHGWNEHLGASMAWRKQQLQYKNTPANGPFAILSARLAERGDDPAHLRYAGQALDWLEATLVGEDGFVQDGVNRLGDGAVDLQWRFTYNQGLYIGACLAWARASGASERAAQRIQSATRTARTAITSLGSGGVFGEGGTEGETGGDVGLFKGVLYRYATLLVETTGDAAVRDFLLSSTEVLWQRGLQAPALLAGDDWTRPWPGRSSCSTQLSAVMATESAARLTRGPARSSDPAPAGSAVPA